MLAKVLWRFGLGVIGTLCAASSALPAPQAGQPGVSRSAESCGRADPSYIYVANETGGQPLFLKPSEAGGIGQFLREMSGSNRETLLWATDTLDRGPRPFTVPVDSTVLSLTFSVSVNREGSTLVVTRPDGVPVRAGDPDVEVTELSCTRVMTVTTPEGGDWRAEIAGGGSVWFQASARTALFLSGVEFVKIGGRPGHEGLFRILGQPLMDSPATLQATLNGQFQTAHFRLITLGWETIGPITMAAASGSNSEREYVGTFELPRQPFRIAVSGADMTSHVYQRVFHSLFHGETVEISPSDGTPEGLPVGETMLTFAIRNIGQVATFRIVAVDSRQFVKRVDPREMTLAAGESGVVTISLSVPPDTPAATGSTLTITATSTSSPATMNSAVRHFDVMSGPPR